MAPKKKRVPKYIYFCKKCEVDFEIKHSLQEVYTNCEICGSDDSLERKPANIFLAKKQSRIQEKSVAGGAVKEAIKEARLDLKQDQHNLQNRSYKK